MDEIDELRQHHKVISTGHSGGRYTPYRDYYECTCGTHWVLEGHKRVPAPYCPAYTKGVQEICERQVREANNGLQTRACMKAYGDALEITNLKLQIKELERIKEGFMTILLNKTRDVNTMICNLENFAKNVHRDVQRVLDNKTV